MTKYTLDSNETRHTFLEEFYIPCDFWESSRCRQTGVRPKVILSDVREAEDAGATEDAGRLLAGPDDGGRRITVNLTCQCCVIANVS